LTPERWHVYVVDLEPPVGTKPGKQWPCLVIQPTELTKAGLRSTVVLPLTTRLVDGAFPVRVRVPRGVAGLDRDSDTALRDFLDL
jgi:mRNA interferase MazF